MSVLPTGFVYDRDYYENGVVAGKSCYENYRWMPEMTIKMAYRMMKHLKLHEGATLLDYGCAKGYLVKALRILDVEAFGCDVSSYAIENVDPEVRPFCRCSTGDVDVVPFDRSFDWVISKDVLEHLDEKAVDRFMAAVGKHTKRMFHVIPLANSHGKFVVPEYERDTTHVLRQTSDWWQKRFEHHGWHCESFDFDVPGIKENWTSRYPKGNGFFILKRNH